MNAWLSAPLIWVVIPIIAGLVFWFLRQRVTLVIFLSTVVCLLLALLAWLLPIGQEIHVSRFSFTVAPALEFAGRRLALSGADRSYLILVYMICAFWFAGSYAAGANRLLIPFGMGVTALLVAALAVEPFLYAALLVEMAVLLAVPILAPPGNPFGQGVLRFLIFQTLAMPFILLAGWALAGVESNPTNTTLVTFATVFLALGFAFWLAVFPFYTWIPLLAEQSHPYSSAFVLLLLPTIQLLLGLNFLDNFGWLRSLPDLYTVIGEIGALMVVTAGVWAAFQKDMARLLGYGVIVETGYSFLAVSLSSHAGDLMFASMFLPRMIGLGLWALSLSILLRQARSTRFEDMDGMAQKMPFASFGLAFAALSLGGLPILAVFPIHQALLEELAQKSFLTALWAMGGSIGLIFSAFRSLSVLARGYTRLPVDIPAKPLTQSTPQPTPPLDPFKQLTVFPGAQPRDTRPRESQALVFCESRMQIALLVSGVIVLLLIGIFPQAFLPLMHGLLNLFPQLP